MYKSAVPDPTSCFWGPHVVPQTFPHTRGRRKIFPGLHGDILMPSPVFTKFAVPGMYQSAVPDPTSCFWGPHVVPKTFPHTRGRWKFFPGLHGDIWMPSPVFTKFAGKVHQVFTFVPSS